MQSRPTLQQIILGFLKLYKDFRTPTRNSATNTVKYGFEFVGSLYTGTPPVDDQLDGIVNALKTRTINSFSFDSYYNLALTFRENAVLAHSLVKYSDSSLLHNTLHVLANIILDELETYIEFDQKVLELENNLAALKKNINHCIKTQKGQGIQKFNEELKKTIQELAWIRRSEYVNEALNAKWLPWLEPLNDKEIEELTNYGLETKINYAIPLQMQKAYEIKLYGDKYQAFKTIDFDRFIENCNEQQANTDISLGTKRIEKDSGSDQENAQQHMETDTHSGADEKTKGSETESGQTKPSDPLLEDDKSDEKTKESETESRQTNPSTLPKDDKSAEKKKDNVVTLPEKQVGTSEVGMYSKNAAKTDGKGKTQNQNQKGNKK